jgi:hypothetical protein
VELSVQHTKDCPCDECCVCKLQAAMNRKKLRDSAHRPAAYSALRITPSTSSKSVSPGRGMHEAVFRTTIIIPTPFLRFETFCSSSMRNQTVKQGENSSNVADGWAVQVMLQITFPSRFPQEIKSQRLLSGDLGGHNLVLMILSLNTSC